MSETNSRENDLVLSPNEYAYVLDTTKGIISCIVGSYKMSLSTSDSLVKFNEKTKRFEKAIYHDAIQTFVSAPENWYVVLKNPADSHPGTGSNNLPDLKIGKKINIPGSVSFPLYPGQMAKVIQGHRMHSNQYILARVYDADVLDKIGVANTETGEVIGERNKYVVGQIIVIKGKEVPFYIPPTGIEVLPVGGKGDQYIRDAVTLERLEYCILKNEKGEKKYVHGADVVFPEPDEVFLKNPKTGDYKFKAIELSDISGVYVKVIADYEENGVKHKTGEELFITGKDQMIYYPRPEHAIIDYEGKVVHHAIAIPVGEGRYVLDREKGSISTVKGPIMFLPDPRKEVVVRRKLSSRQCELWYPGNDTVLRYNIGIDETYSRMTQDCLGLGFDNSVSCNSDYRGDVVVEENGISRGNKYTKPRTIVIDNKLEGVVTIDVWTGYAINVVSKNGDRKVVIGPCTCLLDYDQTLEVLELSTGKPKTTDNMIKTVFLRIENNKISDIIHVQTRDFVDIDIKVSYCVNFLEEDKDKWFSVDNYIKYMTDYMRSLLKSEARKYSIEEFYAKSSEIVKGTVLMGPKAKPVDEATGCYFAENGMFVYDVEVLSVKILDAYVNEMVTEHQSNMVREALELSENQRNLEITKELTKIKEEKQSIENAFEELSRSLAFNKEMDKLEKAFKLEAINKENEKKFIEHNEGIQELLDSIQKSELARKKAEIDQDIEAQSRKNEVITKMRDSEAMLIEKTMNSITPDLISAMESSSNSELLSHVTELMSPYAIAEKKSVVDVVNTLLRGTSLENIIPDILSSINRHDGDIRHELKDTTM